MDFKTYQKESRKTAIYPDKDKNYIYPTLGLVGESGEVAEKIKKVIREKEGKIDDEARELLKKELGDILWYMAQFASELDIDLEDVAKTNLEKVFSRLKRNLIHGNGDNR